MVIQPFSLECRSVFKQCKGGVEGECGKKKIILYYFLEIFIMCITMFSKSAIHFQLIIYYFQLFILIIIHIILIKYDHFIEIKESRWY